MCDHSVRLSLKTSVTFDILRLATPHLFLRPRPYRVKSLATTVRFTDFKGWPVGLEPTCGGTTIHCLNQLGDGHHMHGSRSSRAYLRAFVPTFVYSEYLLSRQTIFSLSLPSTRRVIWTLDLSLMRGALWPTELFWHMSGEGRIRTSNAHRALVLQTNVFTF